MPQRRGMVAEALGYPLKSCGCEAIFIITCVYWNVKLGGQFIVIRRPGEGRVCSQDEYLPCSHCLGFVKRKDLWKHNKACSFKSTEDDQTDKDDYLKCLKLLAESKLFVLP